MKGGNNAETVFCDSSSDICYVLGLGSTNCLADALEVEVGYNESGEVIDIGAGVPDRVYNHLKLWLEEMLDDREIAQFSVYEINSVGCLVCKICNVVVVYTDEPDKEPNHESQCPVPYIRYEIERL